MYSVSGLHRLFSITIIRTLSCYCFMHKFSKNKRDKRRLLGIYFSVSADACLLLPFLSVHHLLQQCQFFLDKLRIEVLLLHIQQEGLGLEETALVDE